VHAVIRALEPQHPQPSGVEVNLSPLQPDQLADAQPMPVRHQDHQRVAIALLVL